MDVIEAVTAAVGVERFDVVGMLGSAALAVPWAAARPGTVRSRAQLAAWFVTSHG